MCLIVVKLFTADLALEICAWWFRFKNERLMSTILEETLWFFVLVLILQALDWNFGLLKCLILLVSHEHAVTFGNVGPVFRHIRDSIYVLVMGIGLDKLYKIRVARLRLLKGVALIIIVVVIDVAAPQTFLSRAFILNFQTHQLLHVLEEANMMPFSFLTLYRCWWKTLGEHECKLGPLLLY